MIIDFRDVFAAQSGEHQLSDKDKLSKGEQGSGGLGRPRGVGREVGGAGIERRGLW